MSVQVTITNNQSVTLTNNSGVSKVVVAPYPVWLGTPYSPAFVVAFDGSLTPSEAPVITDPAFRLDSYNQLTPQ